MSDAIGITAGRIWQYLDKNGASSVSKITTETTLNRNAAQRAIGWLAKENKINFDMDGRTELLSLK